ncbi:MAG: hypothetical protein ACE5NW_13150 [Acidiferrobacterales bacterium]
MSKSARWPKFVAVGVILLLLGIFVLNLPRGYSVDLSRIGKGSDVVVLVHDQGIIASERLMRVVDAVRPDYEGRIEFLVADLNLLAGREFAEAHGVESVTLLLFRSDGRRLKTLQGLQDEVTLRDALNRVFGY